MSEDSRRFNGLVRHPQLVSDLCGVVGDKDHIAEDLTVGNIS